MTEERGLTIATGDDQLSAVLHVGMAGAMCGVVIVVGGPQYRVGSHRQFLHLARRLAAAGFPVMRFDVRGMGDSGGQPRSFLDIKDDIRAAVDAICREIPTIRSVCLWGLCDGATAAALYAPSDPRVSGLVMANPWVHTEVTRSEALVRSYYVAKLLSLEFWRRLLGGKVALRNSLREASRAVRSVAAGGLVSSSAYVDQLVTSVSSFDGKVLVMLSEHDLVADEFRGLLRSSAIAASGFAKESVQILDIEGANHTFSRAAWRDIVASRTLRWLDGASREKAVAGVG